jgi:hypothetical protein
MDVEKYLKKVTDEITADKAKLKAEKAKNDILKEKREGFNLRLKNTFDSNVKKWGYLLGLYTFFGFLASTSLSIAGGIDNFKGFKVYAFILMTIFIQSGIIIFSIKESAIKKTNHYFSIKCIQYSLILLSIYFNWCFFSAKSGWILLLCIIIELTVIKSAAIGGDFRSLTFKFDKSNNDLNVRPSLFKIILYNLTFKYLNNQVRLYNENKASENKIGLTFKNQNIKLLDEAKTKLDKSNNELDENNEMLDYENVKKYLLDHYSDNECIIGLKEKFDLNLTNYRKIMEKLKLDNVIYTNNKKTYLKPQSLKVIEGT